MTVSLTYGQPVPFPGILQPFPVRNRSINAVSCQVAWTANGQVYLIDTATYNVPLKNIVTVYVDNLSNTNALVIIFPDTNYRFTMPAMTDGFFPALTNGTKFIVYNVDVNVGDVANVFLFDQEIDASPVNEAIPNVAFYSNYENIPTILAQPTLFYGAELTFASGSISFNSGYLEPVLCSLAVFIGYIENGGESRGNCAFVLEDASNNVLWSATIYCEGDTQAVNQFLVNITGLQIPCKNNLKFTATPSNNVTGAVELQVYFGGRG